MPETWRGYGAAARARFDATFAAPAIARQLQAIVRARLTRTRRRARDALARAGPMTMRRDLIQLGRNFLLSLGGEGLQSGFHFILTLVLIRLLSLHDFGIFAIAFVLGGIALTYGNAFVTVPATVRLARMKSRGAVDYLDVVFGSIALLVSDRRRDPRGARALAHHRAGAGSARRRRLHRLMDAAQSRAHRDVRAPRHDGRHRVGLQLYGERHRLRRGRCCGSSRISSVAAVLSALAAANIVAIAVALRAVNRAARELPAAARAGATRDLARCRAGRWSTPPRGTCRARR